MHKPAERDMERDLLADLAGLGERDLFLMPEDDCCVCLYRNRSSGMNGKGIWVLLFGSSRSGVEYRYRLCPIGILLLLAQIRGRHCCHRRWVPLQLRDNEAPARRGDSMSTGRLYSSSRFTILILLARAALAERAHVEQGPCHV